MGSASSPATRLNRAKRRDRGHFWSALSRVLSALVAFSAVVVLTLYLYPEINKRDELADTLAKKKEVLSAEQDLHRARERERFLLENDPEYIEAIARDRLDLMKEGETIIRLDPAPGSPTATAGKNP